MNKSSLNEKLSSFCGEFAALPIGEIQLVLERAGIEEIQCKNGLHVCEDGSGSVISGLKNVKNAYTLVFSWKKKDNKFIVNCEAF